MGHYDARDEYYERMERYYAKLRRIRDAGYNPDHLEDAYKQYQESKRHIQHLEWHEKIVFEYENSDGPKWEDFK